MANSVPVQTIVNTQNQESDYWIGEAKKFLQTLKDNAGASIDANPININDQLPSSPWEGTIFARLGTEPSVSGSTTFSTPGSNPGGVSLTSINTTLDEVTLPDYTVATPTINLPTRPELAIPSAPSAPLIEDISVPAAPTVELPTAPSISAVSFPDAPTLSLPTFAEAAPELPASFVQTNNFEWSEEGLPTPLLDAINGKLLTDVADGGYGIETTDETALWARGRDRELAQLDGIETETEEMYANRGYSMPPGALLNALSRARKETEDRISELGREVAIKRADLYRDNRQFAITQGQSVENIYLQHYGFRLERALNAQRFAAEYAINVHDALIRNFNATLQRYEAIANVYRTRLQAALTQIQIYEAEVRAAVARQDANRLDVELYQALLQAATTRINLFESQVRAASLIADLQRVKIDSYRSEVGAFTARIQANESQLNAYRAEIGGEQAKVDIFRTEVGAYGDRVRAAGTEQDIASEKVRVELQKRNSQLDVYRTKLAKYTADIETEKIRINAILQRYSSDATVFSSALAGYEALSRVSLLEEEAQISAIQEQTKRAQENSRLTLEAATNELETRFTAANAGSDLTTGVVSALQSSYQGIAIEQENTDI